MTPVLVWSIWTLVNGTNTPTRPPGFLLATFVVCPLLYLLLVQMGRQAPPPGTQETQTTNETLGTRQTVPPAIEESTLRPISKQEETELRNCFPWGVYYLQNVEYRPQAVLCRGKLRTNPESAYKTVRENIEAEFGDRFFVIFQESFNGNPFFALVPNPQAQQSSRRTTETMTRPGLALGLLVITLFTTTLGGAQLAAGKPIAINQIYHLLSEPSLLLQGLPYGLALMAILGIHELGHYLAARFYKLRTTLPYFIPVPPMSFFSLGTFGAFIQMRSPVPNRKSLFDVGIAGPLAGFIITIPILIWGLAHSSVVSLSNPSGLLTFESLNPRFSFLLTLLSKLALGSQMTPETAIDLHPVAVAGYIGLVVTALNLMPVGQLDGGHIVHAMFGQRTGATIGRIAQLLVLVLAFQVPDLMVWAVLLILMPVADEPALNDVSELDNWRDFLGLLALAILVSIILPPPSTITGLLNI
jgi:membrane-associated protease RseP (regulator of RpoE activity)